MHVGDLRGAGAQKEAPPIPARAAFVESYCAWRDLPPEHAGKIYDLLATEYPRALADWAGLFMEEVRRA